MIAAMTALSPDPRQQDLDLRTSYGPLRRCGAGALPSPRYPRFSPFGLPKRVIPLRVSPLRRRSLGPYPHAIEAPYRGFKLAKETVMIIGNFTYDPARDSYTGELSTLTVAARTLVFQPNEAK